MKNYRALAKLRKQQFDRAEQALATINASLHRLRQKRESLRKEFAAIEPPASGSGGMLGLVVQQRRAMQQLLDTLQQQIAHEETRRHEAQQRLKEAHVAWEQAKSIESQLLTQLLKKRARLEQGHLDEIASQRFWRKRNEER